MKTIKLFLESEEFGYEEFEYDTQEEADAGLKRLLKSASDGYSDDNICRKVGYVIGKEANSYE